MKKKKNQLTKGLIVQLVLLIILIILMVLSIFYKIFLPIADFVAGILFMVMAYNKKDQYKKPMLIALIIFGLLFMGFGVFNIING